MARARIEPGSHQRKVKLISFTPQLVLHKVFWVSKYQIIMICLNIFWIAAHLCWERRRFWVLDQLKHRDSIFPKSVLFARIFSSKGVAATHPSRIMRIMILPGIYFNPYYLIIVVIDMAIPHWPNLFFLLFIYVEDALSGTWSFLSHGIWL